MTVDKQYFIGMDDGGITDVSLKALEEIAERGNVLEKVEIAGGGTSEVVCSFIFKDHGIYNASGFSVGYGGEGPHGLYKAIKVFHPGSIEDEFGKTPIAKLDPERSWNWYPQKGFILA